MTARAIQNSVLQTVAAVIIGGAIEGLLPSMTEDASLTNQAFEALVQVGLVGASVSTFGGLVRGEGIDPTCGIPFSMALFWSQQELARRIAVLSLAVKAQVVAGARRMVPQVTGA